MTPAAAPPGLDAIDWSRPWLVRWRERGQALAERVRCAGLVDALNTSGADCVRLRAGRLRFVEQRALPAGEAYEAFIARTACVPTRANLHDFFNGLAWLVQPDVKRRLNELQAGQIAAEGPGVRRGVVRDALTLLDENGALLQAPQPLVEALRERDWRALFVTRRALWADARFELFGHALLEKLIRPRKPIVAHVWLVPIAESRPDAFGALAGMLTAPALAARPYLPLPVLGVPGWWPANAAAAFYDDAAVFRPTQKKDSGPAAAVLS